MNPGKQHGGWLVILLISAVIGAGIVMASLALMKSPAQGTYALAADASAEYGRKLIRETSVWIGPTHEDPAMRYSGNNLDCSSCHLETGTKPGALSLLNAASNYPRFSGRDGGVGDLRQRIDGCMERSMNGRKLPRNSVEMISMEMYILGLGSQYEAMGETRRKANDPAAFVEPARTADVEAGKVVYEENCQVCHGENGLGLLATEDVKEGYLFPPLWGSDSFNDGAGMGRLLTAAAFIKARMPLGKPDLSNDQAFDVAAYINSRERPHMANLEKDYPDLATKPVDSPYPPYADPFPIEQHRIGPYAPIRDYYKSLK